MHSLSLLLYISPLRADQINEDKRWKIYIWLRIYKCERTRICFGVVSSRRSVICFVAGNIHDGIFICECTDVVLATWNSICVVCFTHIQTQPKSIYIFLSGYTNHTYMGRHIHFGAVHPDTYSMWAESASSNHVPRRNFVGSSLNMLCVWIVFASNWSHATRSMAYTRGCANIWSDNMFRCRRIYV